MSKQVVLIVDDDPLNIQVINEKLMAHNANGLEVLNATSANLGLKIAQSVLPDLIVTDWEMPNMNGLEFIQALKENGATKHIPVIMATGIMTTSKDLDMALASGANDYIRKPIDEIELIARVRSGLELADNIQKVATQKDLILKQKEALHQQELDFLKESVTSSETKLADNIKHLLQSENERAALLEQVKNLEPHLSEKGQSVYKSIVLELKQQENNLNLLDVERKFDEINSNFYKQLERLNPEITKNEKVLCAFLVMGYAPTDIAAISKKSLNSINVAFSRLRSKLSLETNVQLKERLVKIKGE